jgi:hypothetical protein
MNLKPRSNIAEVTAPVLSFFKLELASIARKM